MKVQDPNLTAPSIATAPAAAPSPPNIHAMPSDGQARDDRVELSGFAGRLTSALGAEALTRARRVAALAHSFQSGRLALDSRQTSRALVNETLSASERSGQARK
jgi:hypothetical protein